MILFDTIHTDVNKIAHIADTGLLVGQNLSSGMSSVSTDFGTIIFYGIVLLFLMFIFGGIIFFFRGQAKTFFH